MSKFIWKAYKEVIMFVIFIATLCIFLYMSRTIGFESTVIVMLTLIFTGEIEHRNKGKQNENTNKCFNMFSNYSDDRIDFCMVTSCL